MDCPKCGASNAPLKKCCSNCGSILTGWTVNNVTGEHGYRNPDGSFTKEPKLTTNIDKVYIAKGGEPIEAHILMPQPIGRLTHEPTGYSLAVYKPISRFKRFMLRWCFGVKFEKV